MKRIHLLGALLAPFFVFSQGLNAEEIDQLTQQHWHRALDLLQELVATPSDAAIASNLAQTEELIIRQFANRGFTIQRLETSGVPLLLATYEPDNSEVAQSLLLYFHADGQAVDPSKWFQDDPYVATLKAYDAQKGWAAIDQQIRYEAYDAYWRLFGRATSDAKGPIAMFLSAWDALSSINQLPAQRLKIVIDLEEEQGSASLPEAVALYGERLKADAMLIFDGPRHVSNRPTLTFGARGIANVTLEVFGPKLPQHSGHYGNYAPNPAFQLAQLLASMKDSEGRVLIQDYYKGIDLSANEREQLAKIPDDEVALRKRLGFSSPEKVAQSYQESLQYPSLNIRGLQSAYVGTGARTIIPATALAEIDIRLVPESDPEAIIQRIRNHIEAQGFTVIDSLPTDAERMTYKKLVRMRHKIAYGAFRTDLNAPIANWLRIQMQRAGFNDLVELRLMGGSIPIAPFVTALGIDAVIIPTVNADNNQHSPNENIRLGNYYEGIQTMLGLLSAPQ